MPHCCLTRDHSIVHRREQRIAEKVAASARLTGSILSRRRHRPCRRVRDASFDPGRNVSVRKLGRVRSSNYEGLLMLPNHQSIAPSVLYFGTPVVLMVTRNDDGRVGLGFMRGPRLEFGDPGRHQSSAGWRMHPQFSRGQPLGECRTDRAHHGCESVPPHKAELGFVHEADKFALGGFAIQPSELILTPRIAECPLRSKHAC